MAKRDHNWNGIGVGIAVAFGGVACLIGQWQVYRGGSPTDPEPFWNWLSVGGVILCFVGVLIALGSTAFRAAPRTGHAAVTGLYVRRFAVALTDELLHPLSVALVLGRVPEVEHGEIPGELISGCHS